LGEGWGEGIALSVELCGGDRAIVAAVRKYPTALTRDHLKTIAAQAK
jgi:hypothetical protein